MTELNNENYFSPKMMLEYMSTSQFKAFEECEAAALVELQGEAEREEKECFLEGHYFEACICGTGEEFLLSHAEMVSSRGSTKGELKSNHKKVQESVNAFNRQCIFNDIISHCAQQVIVTGVIAGIKFKGCIDFLDLETGNGYDTKCMKDFKRLYSESDDCYVNWYFARGYHYQAAIYRELIKQTYGKTGRQHLMAATKENTPDVAYLQFTDEILDNALDIIMDYSPKYVAIKKGEVKPIRCEKCNYCKSTKIITSAEIVGEYE